ncbi:MAG: glycosyltransferase family 2 protein [Gammaproteobacteria bacterium]
MAADVTVCIPAYRAASFIDRTINCALAQTHKSIRILISVDKCEDDTAEICRRHAREDPRIEVVVHPERLGWSKNVNSAIDRVDTEYFFVYFHDDIISPSYVERLLKVMKDRTDAASAHCDLIEFGLLDEIKPANSYEGPAIRRLIEFLMTRKGTALRSLMRTDAVIKSLRFPEILGDNQWAVYPFHLELLAAGPALGLSAPLYKRWNRNGSLTRSKNWLHDDMDSFLNSQRESAKICLDIVERAAQTPGQRKIGCYCLALFFLRFTREQELRMNDLKLRNSAVISEKFSDFSLPYASDELEADVLRWVRAAEADLLFFEAKILRQRGDAEAALSRLTEACSLA